MNEETVIVHRLKIGDERLNNIRKGTKKVEIRFNDRDYQVGDILAFGEQEHPDLVECMVTHVHSGLGMAEGYVALSIRVID